MEAIIEIRLRTSVRLHEVLHGFCACRVTGTEILELNVAQELASVDQYPILLIFLDIKKSYDIVDHGRLLTNLD